MKVKMLMTILLCLLCSTTAVAQQQLQQMVYVGPDKKNQKVIDRYNRCHFRVTINCYIREIIGWRYSESIKENVRIVAESRLTGEDKYCITSWMPLY